MSEGFGVGNGDGTAGGIRDAHALVIAMRQQTKMAFTSFRTLMIAVVCDDFSFTCELSASTRC